MTTLTARDLHALHAGFLALLPTAAPPQAAALAVSHLDPFPPVPGGTPMPRAAVVCRPLTGLVTYHDRDNAFAPFARLMRFVLAFYDVHHALRQGPATARPNRRRRTRRPAPAAVPA
jgi:hypothetical protein